MLKLSIESALASLAQLLMAATSEVSELVGSEEDSNGEELETENEFENSLSSDDKEEFLREIENASKKVSILCAGPTGVGKSTLLNGLIGSKEEEEEFKVGESLKRGTLEVHKREFVKNGVAFTAWDTPGLENVSATDSSYMKKIKEECADFDLFMYCISADEARATEIVDEESSLLKFTELFGPKLWKNGIIVLTFCNGVVGDLEDEAKYKPDVKVEREFTKKIAEWSKKLREALLQRGAVDKKIVKKIPIVPAGIADSPDLPGSKFWLSHLFSKVQERMKEEAKVAYILLNEHRMKRKDEVNTKTLETTDIQDQPIVEVSAGVGVGVGVGVTGAVVGATIGATIGALAIGIPTFGIAAGLGLLLGGALGAGAGAGAGTVSGVGTGMLVKWYKKKKRMKRNKKKNYKL